jgi:mxaK protein
MKIPRRAWHALFAALCIVLIAAAGWQAWQWREAQATHQRLLRATTATTPPAGAEEQLAWASAVAGAGRFDEAVKLLKTLAQQRADLRPTALYNLGTLYLQEAQRRAGPQGEALPLVELAKQPLRELLRSHPDDWPARYQLERALRLAPEVDDSAGEDATPDVPKERTMSTGPAVRIELP